MTYDLKDLRVCIAIPVNRDFPWQTTKALVETAGALATKGIPFEVRFLTQGSQIDHDRSELARQFLLTDCNKLFWIDSDMSWEVDGFLRVLALSTVKDIVGATYPAKKGPPKQFHILYDANEIEADEHGCFSVLGMGMGFVAMDRLVIEDLSFRAQTFVRDGVTVPMIFRTGIGEDGVYRSEDMHFFKACTDAGYSVYVDPTITLGHTGGYEWKGKLLDALTRPTVNGHVVQEALCE